MRWSVGDSPLTSRLKCVSYHLVTITRTWLGLLLIRSTTEMHMNDGLITTAQPFRTMALKSLTMEATGIIVVYSKSVKSLSTLRHNLCYRLLISGAVKHIRKWSCDSGRGLMSMLLWIRISADLGVLDCEWDDEMIIDQHTSLRRLIHRGQAEPQ